MSLGKNIAALRKEQGLTQAQLGERLGVSNQAVSKWEKGMNLPDVMLLPQIAKAFGVTIDRLFEKIEAEEKVEIPDKLVWILRQEYDGATLTLRFPIHAMERMMNMELEQGRMRVSAEEWKEFRETYCRVGTVLEELYIGDRAVKIEVVRHEN